MNVANRKWIRRLSWKSLRAARTRNLVAVLAIALTTVLFTALFTIALSINDGFQQTNFRQVGGWSHGGFKYLTEEQFLQLRDDPLIQEWGLRRFVGMPVEVPFNKSHVEVGYSDPNQAHWMYCDPVVGRLPEEGTDEAATDTRVLELLGITPQLGWISHLILIVLMFFGRVGGLTLIFAALSNIQGNSARLPQERITVG